MKQILGNNLTGAIQALKIKAELKWKNDSFEVWELSDSEFERFCNVPDEEWDNEQFGWWRYSNGCILEGSTLYEYTVNGNKMLGYIDQHEIENLNEGESPDDMVDETYFTETAYQSFTSWLSSVLDISTEKNITAVAISLAKENGLTLAEFMRKYQPETEKERN